jgi:flagellin
MKISLTSITLGALGLTLTASGWANPTSVTMQAAAFSTVTCVDNALHSLNNMRSNIGAYMNRLEHAITGLEVQESNMQSAESQIRDADFAKQTTAFTKDQILMQAGTAMLGQANRIPSMVLSLLQ